MTATRKILFYNWCPIASSEGGGVALYIRNVVSALAEQDSITPVFLNSGFYYDNSKRGPYIRKSSEPVWKGCECYDLVNSPVIAPMRSPAENIDAFVHDETLLPMFKKFLAAHSIDVVHFNNFEGLSLSCLRAKDSLPDIRFVYSIHNYTLFCPAVNLWTSEGTNCFGASTKNCARCMARYSMPSVEAKRRFRMRTNPALYFLGRAETHALNAVAWSTRRKVYSDAEHVALFNEYRFKQVESINRYFDAVLAVSKRVAEIAKSCGIDERILHVEYIGTRFASSQVEAGKPSEGDVLNLIYMGYMRSEKGYPFLIEALEGLPDEILGKISLTVAAKLTDYSTYRKMNRLRGRLANLRYYNGYSHDQLSEIVSGQDLGVVPVLWEDNLPQIAVELASMGIPVLASSFGGASELTESDLFRFAGGDVHALRDSIAAFVKDKSLLADYWLKRMRLVTMDEHVQRLLGYYA